MKPSTDGTENEMTMNLLYKFSSKSMERGDKQELEKLCYSKLTSNILKFNLEAIVAIFTLALSVLPEVFNMAIVSNYGSLAQVAGIGLGVMFINMFVFGAFEGLNGAIDTLVSQYYGARDYYGCNITLNRARMINSFMFIPCAIVLVLSKEILVFLDQDLEVAIVAQKFLIFQIPGLFVFTHFDIVRRYLQAMGHF